MEKANERTWTALAHAEPGFHRSLRHARHVRKNEPCAIPGLWARGRPVALPRRERPRAPRASRSALPQGGRSSAVSVRVSCERRNTPRAHQRPWSARLGPPPPRGGRGHPGAYLASCQAPFRARAGAVCGCTRAPWTPRSRGCAAPGGPGALGPCGPGPPSPRTGRSPPGVRRPAGLGSGGDRSHGPRASPPPSSRVHPRALSRGGCARPELVDMPSSGGAPPARCRRSLDVCLPGSSDEHTLHSRSLAESASAARVSDLSSSCRASGSGGGARGPRHLRRPVDQRPPPARLPRCLERWRESDVSTSSTSCRAAGCLEGEPRSGRTWTSHGPGEPPAIARCRARRRPPPGRRRAREPAKDRSPERQPEVLLHVRPGHVSPRVRERPPVPR